MSRCCSSPASTSGAALPGCMPTRPARSLHPRLARQPHAPAPCTPLVVAPRAVRADAVRKTFASFDDMIKESPVPILVDFHAAWCGPCRLMSDSVAAAARELGPETVKVVKIDADAYPALASRFRVSALPTLLLFRSGAAVDRVEGYLGPADLAQRVRYYCKSLDLKFGRKQ